MNTSGIPDSFGDPQNPDTICGLATPLGQGGLGVIRVSGPETLAVADRVFHGKHHPSATPSHRILYGRFAEPETGNELDEVVLSVFRNPNSYTGEDVVELSFHGSPAVLTAAIEVLTGAGCRLAQPGEFTFRAFSNGRIDLTQAEAVIELVQAKSEKSAQAAYCQLQGSLKDLISQLRADLIEGLAWLEMSSDFVEEDIDFKKVEEISARLDSILTQVETLEQAYERSRVIRDGLLVTIVGAPNTGKSSLFNRLLARERSIVTDIPGTTRDSINEYLILGGYPVCLIDTAGIRRAADAIETIGIDRTVRHLEDSDLVLWVLDATAGYTEEDREIRRMIASRPAAALINKADLADGKQIAQCRENIDLPDCFAVSAVTGDGLDTTAQWLVEHYLSFKSDRQTQTFIINERHLVAMGKARMHLKLARGAIEKQESHEFAAFDVRQAADYLGEITGETTPDDILNKIFADFCIGK